MSHLLPSEIVLKAAIAVGDLVKVRFCDGDGCVPVLNCCNGNEMNYTAFAQFLEGCSKRHAYPMLFVEAARKAWVEEGADALDEMHLEYDLRGGILYIRENFREKNDGEVS